MEQLKHECGVAMIRLKKPLSYYTEKYGTPYYALSKMHLLMEKQRNRGQEGAGVACVKLSANAGEEYMFRERKEGKNAISELFTEINNKIKDPETPFVGECYMGHLRYSTTGRSGITYVHPMLSRQNYRHNTFALCGNFNMTNVEDIFNSLTMKGQHPRRTSDTTVLLEQLGTAINEHPLSQERVENILSNCAPSWDGGYVICGLLGNGEMFAVRDPWAIRPAFYYSDDEIVVVASERPVIQTVMNVRIEDIKELQAGESIMLSDSGEMTLKQIMEPKQNSACSFERIYFSRGSDADIYIERKNLGAALVPAILDSIDQDLDNSVFSFIPNTAEVAFGGMCEELNHVMNQQKFDKIKGGVTDEELMTILKPQVRTEKVAIKDIKLRTFISESGARNIIANHVYDITYGSIVPQKDNLIVIDDSIVRGTTLKESIIAILSRLQPKKLVVVSSAPQIRYPDFYGIDMSAIGDLVAFRAAVELRGFEAIKEIYQKCLDQEGLDASEMVNYVQEVYAPLTDELISQKIIELVTPKGVDFPIEIIFQKIDKLAEVIPNHRGDWYFSGNYPTKGGVKQLNNSFIQYCKSIF